MNCAMEIEHWREQEWGYQDDDTDLDCCDDAFVNASEFHDEILLNIGLNHTPSEWAATNFPLLDENGLLVSLSLAQSPSGGGEYLQSKELPHDYADVFDIQDMDQCGGLVYDKILSDFSSNPAESGSSDDLALEENGLSVLSSIPIEDLMDVVELQHGPNSQDVHQHSRHCTGNHRSAAEVCSSGNSKLSARTVLGAVSNSSDWAKSSLIRSNSDSAEFKGLRLLHLLTACAEAMSNETHDLVDILLCRLQKLVSPTGSTIERVAYYLSQSLLHRHQYSMETVLLNSSAVFNTSKLNYLGAFSLLNQVYPFIRFAHFTANQSILEAIPPKAKTVHIVDLDIMEGMQWPPLMEALKSEGRLIGHLKITAFRWEDEDNSVPFASCSQTTGRRLSDYATSLGIPFSFYQTKLENVGEKFSCDSDEVVIVNCMWELPHMFQRSRNLLWVFLENARDINPALLTMGTGPHGIQFYQQRSFMDRFDECVKNMCAVFDCAEAGLGEAYRLARATIERLFLGPIMCRPILDVENDTTSIRVVDIPLRCGFAKGDISSKSMMFAQSMVLGEGNPEALKDLKVESGGKHELLLSWHSTLLSSVSTWRSLTTR